MAEVVDSIKKEKCSEIKYDWYQTESHVILQLLEKNVKNCQIKFSSNKVEIHLEFENGAFWDKVFQLADFVQTEDCNYKVTASKVEVKLKKASFVRWSTLITEQAETKSKDRNWDKVVAEMEKEELKDSDEAGTAINSLFHKIYSQGSDEVKKAMNKSFVESGGTVLSTNWESVGKSKVDMKPPDGLEWKSWNQ